MKRTSMRRMLGVLVSVGAATVLAGGPLLFAVRRPDVAPADTPVTNAGVTVNALNPSDDIHQVTGNVDPTNHQDSSKHPSTYAQFVIDLGGLNSTASNFTAPISASWMTQSGGGGFTSYTSESGSVSFANRYVVHYQFVNIPVQYSSSLAARGIGAYGSFNLVITSATYASIGRSPATVYVWNGTGGALVP